MTSMLSPEIRANLLANTSFSPVTPGLQTAVDSTSLGDFKLCPRLYWFREICGWTPREESVHLTFGILLHSARERYDHHRASSLTGLFPFDGQTSHSDALDATLDWALRATWNKELSRPWTSDHKTKNRLGFIRTLVWYLDTFGKDDPFETVIRASGKPSVELSFTIDSGAVSHAGEAIQLCGHIDRVAKLNSEYYVLDLKTTEQTLSPSFFSKFTPDNQFSLYALAGQVILDRPIAGIVVDAVQVAVTFSRFERQIVPRGEGFLEEWAEETRMYLGQMEDFAGREYWPGNDKACSMYGGCAFREVCARPPGAREPWLKANFKRRTWDPLRRRGDI